MGGGVGGAEAPLGCALPMVMGNAFVRASKPAGTSGEIYSVTEQFEPTQPWSMQHCSWSGWLPQPAWRVSSAISMAVMQQSLTVSVLSANTGHGPITIAMTSRRFSQMRVYGRRTNIAADNGLVTVSLATR